jgi:hypothetical protein
MTQQMIGLILALLVCLLAIIALVVVYVCADKKFR